MLWELLRAFFFVLFLSPLILIGVFAGYLVFGQPKKLFSNLWQKLRAGKGNKKPQAQQQNQAMPPMEVRSGDLNSNINSVMAVQVRELKSAADSGVGTAQTVQADVASICLRFYPKLKQVHGLMLLYGTPKKRQPSMYDLGTVVSSGFTDKVVAAFVQAGKTKLKDLGRMGKSRRKAGQAHIGMVEQEASAFLEQTNPVSVEVPHLPEKKDEVKTRNNPAPVAMSRPPEEQDEAEAKEKAFDPETPFLMAKPISYRGTITSISEFPRGDVKVHGVELLLKNGKKHICFGADLRRAVRESRVGVGDAVEITRIGRKQVSPGKAPMNLWEIHKLAV